MTKPLEEAESVKDQNLPDALDVEELLESSSSSIEEGDSSNPEWLKQDPKNQEAADNEDTDDDNDHTTNNKESDDKAIVVEATMASTPTVQPTVPATAPVSTSPVVRVETMGKEKAGKENGQKEKHPRQIFDHKHVSKLVQDYWRHFNDYNKGKKKATKQLIPKKVRALVFKDYSIHFC